MSKHWSSSILIPLFCLAPTPPPRAKEDPCYPSPCGPNARCRAENGYAICECLPEYHGNPYENCRPECLSNSDCPMNRACIRNKCEDPCPGTCGINAICTVTNHVPVCSCPDRYNGDAFRLCTPIIGKLFDSLEESATFRNSRTASCRPVQPVPLRY